MKPLSKQNIIISNGPLYAKVQQTQRQIIIPEDQFKYVVPRLFPNKKIPLRVLINRKIKQYESFDLNQHLKGINWGKGDLFLANFIYAPSYIFEYGCSKSNIQNNKVCGRAYNTKNRKFEKIIITKWYGHQNHNMYDWFVGKFALQQLTQQEQQISIQRSAICFDFEDPAVYANEVLRAVKRRKKTAQKIQYQFYIDNMDFKDAPLPSDRLVRNIKKLTKGIQKYQNDISFGDIILIHNQYQRVMNEILFRHQVMMENLPIKMPKKVVKWQPKNNLMERQIKFVKDNKVIKLVPKTVNKRIKDFYSKTLFINQNITKIILDLKSKINGSYLDVSFFKQIKDCVIQRFYIEQERQLKSSYSALNDYIINPIAAQLKALLENHPDGWFRSYRGDRDSYMDSKLKRMITLMNNLIRDMLKQKLVNEITKFYEFLQKYSPNKVHIDTIASVKCQYNMKVQLSSIIILELHIKGQKLVLSHSCQKISQGLKKLIKNSLQIFRKINSLQPYIVKQIVGNSSMHQGVKIEMPQEILPEKQTELNPNLIQNNQTIKLNKIFNKIFECVDKIVQPLKKYQRIMDQLVQEIQLNQFLVNSKNTYDQLQQIVEAFKFLGQVQEKFKNHFSSNGVKIGFFYLDFTFAKQHIYDHFYSTKEIYRRCLLAQKQKAQRIFNSKIKDLLRELSMKPKNVRQLVQKNNKIQNLDQILVEDLKFMNLGAIKDICEQFGCRMNIQQIRMETSNRKIVAQLYGSKQQIQRQFIEMKKIQKNKVQKEKEDISENFRLIQITFDAVKVDPNQLKFKENADKVKYIRKRLQQIKADNQELLYKLQILEISNQNGEDITEQLVIFEQDIQPYETLWINIEKWRTISDIWTYEPVGSFKLVQPELQVKQLIQNFKKVIKDMNQRGDKEALILAQKYKTEILQFQPKLKLLKIIKKEGFTQAHLKRIDINLTKQIQFISLQEALKMGFLQKYDQIQSISNEAWNQFSLEQTLTRVTEDINNLKFEMSHYLDKKQNKIYITTNLKDLIENVDTILNNLQSVQFNPMKGLYQTQIKQLHQKSIYISNSLKISEQFQQIFVELHPIFDSTDIVKQMPSQNKQFAKLLRVWLELLAYIKSVRSVNDACSSQNIYEKVRSILSSIQKVKKSLIDYLQKKRTGFSRFYLLSNSQLFGLFANSSDISKISSIISKLFDSIKGLSIDSQTNKIIGVFSDQLCQLTLFRPIQYKNTNIQIWMNALQKQIKRTIQKKTQKYIHLEQQNILMSVSSMSFSKVMKKNQKEKKKIRGIDDEFYWLDMIRNQAQIIPQIGYLLFEIQFTIQIESKIRNIDEVIQKYNRILKSLVQQKKSIKQRQISKLKDLILCSLILMTISKVQICKNLKTHKIYSKQNFQFKKILRAYRKGFANEDQNFQQSLQNNTNLQYKIMIASLDHMTQYGNHYLGVYSRLVITNMTERMLLVYMLANWYSLGCAAIGPAGTGKSETTKQIARLNGKTCLIYNCSEDFDVSTLIRLMKAMSVSGLWMCFDQFNRLNHQIFSVIAEQLSFLLKIRNFRHRMEINFCGQLIWLNPTFQFCVTYNPTYKGRQTIPKNIHEMFRNMALVKPDQLSISISLLLCSGYIMGKQLGQKIVKIFRKCRKLWANQSLYDFSLRALKSIIDLANKIFIEKDMSEQNSIISALNILNLPKMNIDDRLEFTKTIKQQFPLFLDVKKNTSLIDQRLQTFNQILSIRDGILLCGQPLSGKKMIIDAFKKQVQWLCQQIYHDTLYVEEIYGKLDPTTRLWSDGIFTEKLRKSIESNEKDQKGNVVIFNGSVYSEWVQNLNSVLDNTRKLSVSSGQIINIPQNFKIIVSCNDLARATPATVSRSGVIIYEPFSFEDIAYGICKDFPKKMIYFFKQLLNEVKDQFKVKIQLRFIMFWVISMLGQQEVTYNRFIYYLSHIMQGILTQAGYNIFDRFCRGYTSINESPFEFVLKSNGEPVPVSKQFVKHMEYDNINRKYEENEEQWREPQFEQIFIKTQKYYKICEVIKQFLARKHNRIFVLFGPQNSGKTRYLQEFLETLSVQQNKKHKIYLTKKSTAKQLYEKLRAILTKKSSNKLGGSNGSRNNVFIQDFNMPIKNKYQVFETCQLTRMMTNKNFWYNYHDLNEQLLEDLSLFTDARIPNQMDNHLNIDNRIFRNLQPLFLSDIKSSQVTTIFKGIFQNFNPNFKSQQMLKCIEFTIDFYFSFKQLQIFKKNIIGFNIMDLRRTLKGILSWNYKDNSGKQINISLFQLSRNFVGKCHQQSMKSEIIKIINQSFNVQITQLPLIHNLEGSDMVKSKYEEIVDKIQFTNKIQYVCDQYKSISKQVNYIIVFPEMVEYLVKIYRTISIDNSHCAIVGLSKCGKKNLVKIASYLISSELNYASNSEQAKQWHQSIKSSLKNCYKTRNSSVLLFQHRQISKQYRINQINTLLNSLHIPKMYSQADIEEIIYLVQIQLIKKNITVSKNSAIQYLLQYLNKKMHIVILFNPAAESFNSYLSNYPSILKYCSFFYIQPWPQEGLNLIGRIEMADLGYNLGFMPKIHQYCSQICKNKNSVLVETWEGMYFNFVTLLREINDKNHIFLNSRKNSYQKGLKIISETEVQLTKTKNKIKKLQPTILLMQSQTSKTVKNINIQKITAKQTNQQLIKKTAQLQKIIKQSKIFKAQLQEKVQIVNQKLQKAWENVSLIKPSHISQVKALANPSQFIKTVLAALVILTYDGPLMKEVVERNGHQYVEDSYFQTAKKHVLSKDAKSICRLLIQFKRQNVSKEMFAKLQQKCLCYKRWGQKQAKSANKAIYYFFIWVDAVANQYRIYEQTRPIREQLQETTNLLNEKQAQIIKTKNDLQKIQKKIEELQTNHKIKKQALQNYRLQIAQFQRMLTRGYQLLKEIEQQKEKWKVYIQQICEKLENNFGDSVMMASSIIYLSSHIYQVRRSAKKKITQLCIEHQIKCSQNPMPWHFTREESQIYHTLNIHENQFLVDNLKIIQNSPYNTFLLLDPEEQGINYIKKLNWQQLHLPIDKISEHSLNLIKDIQSAILYGRIVFLQVNPEVFNHKLGFVIKPTIISNELINRQKRIPIHINYKLFLYATNFTNKRCSMEFLTNTQVVNFKMTVQQLAQRIMEAVIAVEMPLIKNRIQEIYRVNVKDKLTLSNIQQKLLNLFSEQITAEQILQSQEIIGTVVHSNRLFKQIDSRIMQSKEQKDQINKDIKPYQKQVKKVCMMYENILRLKLVSPLYSYSYQWFIELFQTNLHNFQQNLFRQITKGLKNNEKIIVPILIAEITHPLLPWNGLFDSENVDEDPKEDKKNMLLNIFMNNQRGQTLHDKLKIQLGLMINMLPVPKQKWNMIVSRVKKVRKYVPNLQNLFVSKCQIFIPLVQAHQDQILESIPDQFSDLQFFYRIMLVSCFRPEYVLNLLKEWIKINMGAVFTQFDPNIGKLINNTKPNRPILFTVDDPNQNPFDCIKQIYKQNYKGQEVATPIISIHWTPKQQNQFRNLIKGSITQDQWLIVEGINNEEGAEFIKNFFEETIVLPQKIFRIFIILQENGNLPNRFISFCDKIRIIPKRNMRKNITNAFFEHYGELSKKQSDYFQKSKKKLLINQICILHYVLEQFYYYNQQIYSAGNNKKTIYTYTYWDLKLIFSEVLPYQVQNNLKDVIFDMICKITYGSQIRTPQLMKLLEINTRSFLEGVITDRNVFWQTLWSQQKFPKDINQYEHQLKNRLNRQKYLEIFGINSKVRNMISTKNYEKICQLYDITTFQKSDNTSQQILQKLQNLMHQMSNFDSWKLKTEIQTKISQLKTNKNVRTFETFFKKQSSYYFSQYQKIMLDISYFINIIQSKGTQLEAQQKDFIFSLYMNRVPFKWLQSNTKMTPYSFIMNLQDNIKYLKLYIQECQNPLYPINFNFISQPHSLFSSIFQRKQLKNEYDQYYFVLQVIPENKLSPQELKQIVDGDQIDPISLQITKNSLDKIVINNLYSWNFMFIEDDKHKFVFALKSNNNNSKKKESAMNQSELRVAGILNIVQKNNNTSKIVTKHYLQLPLFNHVIEDIAEDNQPLFQIHIRRHENQSSDVIRNNCHFSLNI